MRDVGTLLEALPVHPGVPRPHRRHQVRRRGDDRPGARDEFARDVVLLKYVGMNPVVVHGGGPDITAYMERLQMPVEFVGGLRVSDEATVEVAKMVLVGKVNKDIVLRLSRHGQPAVGLCGDDGSLLRVRARRRRAARTSASSGTSTRSTPTCSSTSRRTTSRSSRRSAPTAGATPTTSTPTRPPARSRASSAPTRSSS